MTVRKVAVGQWGNWINETIGNETIGNENEVDDDVTGYFCNN